MGALYGCSAMGVVELGLEYSSRDCMVWISFFKLLTFLIIQRNPASAIMQATPRTAPTVAPTTVVILFEGLAVMVDVLVDVVVVVDEFESFEVAEVPGYTLSLKRPR